ncbi:MAG: DUF3558 domain-containing protein [Pseudonocardiaceae bacterium]
MRVGLVVALVAALGGCSTGSEQAGDVTPVSASPGRTVSSDRAVGDPIPSVRNPKNLTAIQPCLLLTAGQLEAHRIDQPGQPKDLLGNTGCIWRDKARTREFAMFVDIGDDVLRNVYNQRETIPVFEVTQVAGLPAIRTKDDVDGTSCYFRVAAAEVQTLIVRFSALRPDRADPCDPAKTFAEALIGNLPPLQG